ncbi:hypothetical protein [Shinella zoogloeoides]|uniref:hypothetical protein n=1 Tax=Shinella zoogloeoides TaxID=352475 RepID=UPI0028ACBB6E|nr:hypothetical protein [Shinella zoogloeoides]
MTFVSAMRNRSSSTSETALSGPYLRAFGLLIAFGDTGAGPRHRGGNHVLNKRGGRRDGGAYARLGLVLGGSGKALVSEELVNKFEIEGGGGRRLSWRMSQPGGQITVNGGFTISKMSFIIIEHSLIKPPEGCEPDDGGFFMVGRDHACVNSPTERSVSETIIYCHHVQVHDDDPPGFD